MSLLDLLQENILRPNLFEIDLDAISHNINAIKKYVGADVKLFAVLKCNGYGFDLVEVGKIVDESDAYAIALADIHEAIILRRNGIKKPILVYANSLENAVPHMIAHKLTPSIDNLDLARVYARAASVPLDIFIKVDTGRYRNGVIAEDLYRFVREVLSMGNLRIQGVYAHLDRSDVDSDRDYVEWQFERFEKAFTALEKANIHIPIKIAASSAEVLQFPSFFLNAVDVGKLLYGIYYPRSFKDRIHLKTTFKALKSRIILTKKIPFGGAFDNSLQFEVKKGIDCWHHSYWLGRRPPESSIEQSRGTGPW